MLSGSSSSSPFVPTSLTPSGSSSQAPSSVDSSSAQSNTTSNDWDKIKEVIAKLDRELKDVQDHGVVHALQMSDNIIERREILKHAMSSLKSKIQEQGALISKEGSDKTQYEKLTQQSKSIREFKKIQFQEKELLDVIKKCSEKTVSHLQLFEVVERILNSVAKQMNELLGHEEYAYQDMLDPLSNTHIFSLGSTLLNLDIVFSPDKKTLTSVSFQKTKKDSSSSKEIKAISEDLMNALVRDNLIEVFESKLLAVCKLYHLVSTRTNCIVTDKSSLRPDSNLTSSSETFLKSTTVMREFEHYIIRENNFPSDKVSMKCDGIWINYYGDKNIIVTLEACGGNALKQTCPVMIFNPPVFVPLSVARQFNFLKPISNTLHKTTNTLPSENIGIDTQQTGITEWSSEIIASDPYTQPITRELEAFQNCLLRGFKTNSFKKVQDSTYHFVATQEVYSDKRLVSSAGVMIKRIPFLTFPQMRQTIAEVKKQMILRDLMLSCFNSESTIEQQQKSLLTNPTFQHHHHHHHHMYDEKIKKVEVEFSTSDMAIYVRTTNDLDFIVFKIEVDASTLERVVVYWNEEQHDSLTNILGKTMSVPIMIHYFYTKVVMNDETTA
ncbi:hypothetical protein C9374_003381 [Naegleria lovaniensis]|uniref:Uncharacterized protein n=1 Tax=Naegleria lovaniensis TaxID=51637 RepID=A0AA88GTL7_NAELO|nr:uncharacterized protein C9374_013680 [Naegleria lovaniensis]XP_044549559.1 uncharacterized protein C9374_003381 [Naegleria lovaniensis]KAG2372672.1 hypothetical protein C9374_013680 [Naegleria lovaniensis]KAG2385566.1 hypothetical protein C9374_003381 [Naegleria lovaniensis]